MDINVKHPAAHGFDQPDGFDSIPDPIVLHIFSKISDIKTLIRCRSVSKRFNSLVPQSDSLLLRVDRVISTTDSDDDGNSFLAFLRTIVKSFQNFISPNKLAHFSNPTRTQNSPTQILRGFENIRSLQIELPAGDLRLEKGTTIKWKAHFGKTLKSCAILGFRGGSEENFGGGGLKMRVVWTISALIAASVRHYMMLDVIREQTDLLNLVVKDKDNEGMVVMAKCGLKECRERGGGEEEMNNNDNNTNNNREEGVWWKSNRTTVPAVRMRMRHEARMELANGMKLEGATLVVVRPISTSSGGGGCGGGSEVEEQSGDVELATGAFGGDGVYGEAVERLLKCKSYILEMNSF